MARRSYRVTAPLSPGVQRIGESYRLVVVADTEVISTYALPASGDVTIGRAHDNALVIDNESISRHHAVVHVGSVITLEDVGSSNGTRVRDSALPPHEPRELRVNELVTVGSLTLILQARFAPAPNRLVTHDCFQERVEEECARATRGESQFAVLGIRVSSGAEEPAIVEALITTLRQADVLAKFGERFYELLLLDTTRAQAEHLAEQMVASLALVASASYVVAQYPADGRSANALMTSITGTGEDRDHGDLVIAEHSMRDLYAVAKQLAASDLPVLILGETGVGKEKMSRAIHDYSLRAAMPFVVINCAALNDNLLESELFGHERGAFTGAHSAKTGLFEAAAGGTMFLDEIGEMSVAIQAKLLRVIEDGEVRRVGGLKSRQMSVRFVAATNLDLEHAIQRGAFREDLYFRLNAATLVIPPLRERPNEVEALSRRFMARATARGTGAAKEIAPAALALLRGYSWPGNIRELRNVIERAVVLSGTGPITAEHLPIDKMRGPCARSANATADEATTNNASADERARVLDALERAGGNQSQAASLLGMSRRTLINRLEQFGLPRPRKGRSRGNDPSRGS